MREERLTLTNGVTLSYALDGPPEAPALLFIHGLGADRTQFTAQVTHFAARYRTVAVSLRGHGASSAPAALTQVAYTLTAMAEDILILLKTLAIERAHVVGNSMGGLVGYALLEAKPETVASLTTFGTTAELHRGGLIETSVILITRFLGPRGMAWLTRYTASATRDVGAQVAAMFRQANKRALMYCAHHVADYDYTPLLASSTMPLLLIRGERDTEINRELGSTLAALERRGHYRLVDLPGAGHFANLEQPDRFNAMLADFLAGTPVASPASV